jgi:hypothetical protein
MQSARRVTMHNRFSHVIIARKQQVRKGKKQHYNDIKNHTITLLEY